MRPEFGDQSQDLDEQGSWNSDLGQLEGDITAVADELRDDLDQLLLQAGQLRVKAVAIDARAGWKAQAGTSSVIRESGSQRAIALASVSASGV